MGFCTDRDYEVFLRQAPLFEQMLVETGFSLTKLWFSVTHSEQRTRFAIRQIDPVRRWKLSPMDLESLDRRDAYTAAKEPVSAGRKRGRGRTRDLPRARHHLHGTRFWRAEASRSRDYGGSGLGLAIVQAIVRAHDGRVMVNSHVGRGTTVTLQLPTSNRLSSRPAPAAGRSGW